MELKESIIYILIQELFENDLLDIEWLKIKYDLNFNQIEKIKQIKNILYFEEV